MYKIVLILACSGSSLFLSCGAQQGTHETSLSTSPPSKQDIVAKLKESSHLSATKQAEIYRQLKADDPDGYTFENEDQLTMYGYGFLWSDDPKSALVIFNLIAEQFPESANAYDSIGEAYFALGEKDLALDNYKKSLAMNPDNYNAEDFIELILYPNKKKETPAALFVKKYTAQAYKDDLDELGAKLIKTNPKVFMFTSEKEFKNIIEAKKALITDQTTYGQFRWHCSEIVAAVNCSHTGMGGFFPENEMLPMDLRFPLQTMWIDGRLYISDALNNEKQVSAKEEILSINEIPVSDIISDIYKHIPSQGLIETTKRLEFNTWSTGLIPYALNFPTEYMVEIKGKDKPITLVKLKTHNDPVRDKTVTGCGEPLCLDFIDDESAVLTVSTFNFYRWNNYDDFTAFMDRSFQEIKDKGIDNLVLDLRFNGGGSPESSIYLLQYLADQPFTYFPNVDAINGGGVREPFDNVFRGNQYYIIDGHGNSTTGHFMAMVKELQLGTIVGEELGSNHFCTAGQTIYKLKNTRLEFYSANAGNQVTANALPVDRGILPDHYVTQGISDYLNKVDVVKNYAIGLVKN